MTEPKIFWSLVFSTILLISGIAGSIQPASASEGYFENDYGKQVSSAPTVCIFQPNDPRISEQRWNNWYSDMTSALATWQSVLEQSSNGYWKITSVEVPLDKLDLLNYNACDITVKFVEKPYIEDGKPANALGWWIIGTGIINIVYSENEYCGKEYLPEFKITVNTFCFGNSIERSKFMGAVLQHEFGHALGLGHYVAFDPSDTQKWYDTNGFGAPSIMTPQGKNEELKKITPIDVQHIRKIYGSQGFDKKTDNIPIFRERVIPKPVIEVSDTTRLTISEDSTSSYFISGSIPDKLFKRGMYLEIIIQKPNGDVEYEAVSVAKTLKTFKHNLVFDNSDLAGKYSISLSFDGTVFDKKSVTIDKKSVSKPSQKNQVSYDFKPTLYVIDESGNKAKSITVKPNQEFSIEGYIYKNNTPQKKVSYQVYDNIGNTRDGTTNNNGFFRHILTAKHSNYQTFEQVGGKDSTVIIKACISSNCESATVYIRGNDHSSQSNINKPKELQIQKNYDSQQIEVKKQNLGVENELNQIISKIDVIEKRISDIDNKFSESYKSLKQAENDFIGDVPKQHIQKAHDNYMKLINEFSQIQGDEKMIVNDIFTLEQEQKAGNVYSVSEIKRDIGYLEPRIDKLNSDMKYISQEIEYAKKAHEKLNSRTCFLVWCW